MMEVNMKGNGEIINKMVKGYWNPQMVKYTKVCLYLSMISWVNRWIQG